MIPATKPTEQENDSAHDDDAKLRAADDVYHLRRVLGDTIRALREGQMMSLPDLAASLSVSETYLQAIEAGETIVTPQIRARLELIFGETLPSEVDRCRSAS